MARSGSPPSTDYGWPPCGPGAGSTSSARQRTTRGGWAGWRWLPTTRGMSWSAIQYLADARLDIGTVTEVGHVDAESVRQRVEDVRGGVEADVLRLAGPMNSQIAATHVPAGVVSHQGCGQPGDEE